MPRFCDSNIESDAIIGKGIDLEELFDQRIVIEKIMIENTPDKRRFLSYRHSSGFGYDTYFEDIEECVVLGKPNSFSVEQTGIIYSKQ